MNEEIWKKYKGHDSKQFWKNKKTLFGKITLGWERNGLQGNRYSR